MRRSCSQACADACFGPKKRQPKSEAPIASAPIERPITRPFTRLRGLRKEERIPEVRFVMGRDARLTRRAPRAASYGVRMEPRDGHRETNFLHGTEIEPDAAPPAVLRRRNYSGPSSAATLETVLLLTDSLPETASTSMFYSVQLVQGGGPITSVGSVGGYGVSSGGIDGSIVTLVRVSPTKAASSPMHWLASATSCSER